MVGSRQNTIFFNSLTFNKKESDIEIGFVKRTKSERNIEFHLCQSEPRHSSDDDVALVRKATLSKF